jgi:hypothetical protein
MIKVEIYHNVSSDAGLGLNTVRAQPGTRQARTSGGTYEARTQQERHALVKVFEYELDGEQLKGPLPAPTQPVMRRGSAARRSARDGLNATVYHSPHRDH